MKNNKYIGLMMAAAMLAATSCSDFNDYNEVPSDALPEGNQTLWQNISSNQDLTDFADLVKQAGFEAELEKSRSYTIFAPKNGSFVKSEFEGMDNKDLLQQFVKNHIAEYNHVATGAVNMRIHTLNEKSYIFEGNGKYTFAGIDISKPNLPSNNGVIHMLDNYAHFYPNLYEYLKVAEIIDSLRNHFMHYEVTYLDEGNSVKGPMVDGMQTYIDSVMVTYNSLCDRLGAKLDNEDSTYTFIMPTSQAFSKSYKKIASYYKYVDNIEIQDVQNYTKATDTKIKTVQVNADYQTDSLTRMSIVNNLIFSNNDLYNQWLIGKGENTDTIRSTRRTKLSNPEDLLTKYMVGNAVPMSNGYARIVDSLAIYPWEAYTPKLEINPKSLSNKFPNSVGEKKESVPDTLLKKVFGEDFDKTSYKYTTILANGERTQPDFAIELPGVMSTTYNFYVVLMPSAWKQFGNDPRPNWLNFELNYANAAGKATKYYFSKPYADAILSGGTLPEPAKSVSSTTAFTNDPEKTDTIFIGRFTFPISYSNIGDYYPSIRVTTPISVFNKKHLETYNRDVRLAAIILKPLELDEFEANNK